MAPRSELPLDSSIVEFKPRLGAWASYDAWSQPKLQFSDDSSDASVSARRRVRFARSSENKVIDYMHVSEYSTEEKKACWFRRSDYQAMKAHNAATVDKMTNRIPLCEEEECHFGLETRTPRENMLCRQIMRLATIAVLDEQDDQLRFDGCLNDEILAARYMSCTWEAKDNALLLGRSQATSS